LSESHALTDTIKRRQPWLAALLSLITPGLGQLYCRRPKRAATWYLVALVGGVGIYFLVSRGILVPTRAAQWTFSIALAAFYIVMLIDAWFLAKRVGSIALAWYSRWYVYLLIPLSLSIVGLFAPTKPALETFAMPSASMNPTLVVGDIFSVSTSAYQYLSPQPGDVVILKKEEGGRSFVKRVVAVGGDHVQMKDGRLYVNGAIAARESLGDYNDPGNGTGSAVLTLYRETLPNGRSYRIAELSDKEFFDNTPEFLVPSGQLFLMGDNRDSSMDSRASGEFGFIPVEHVIGRVVEITGSEDSSRVGLKIE
jgi:signal peptidase I